MYSVRTHSLRKYFRTQLSAAKIDTDIIQYMMGHVTDTYQDSRSLGVEKLRELYIAADLTIRPKTRVNRLQMLKEIARLWGIIPGEIFGGTNPEEILAKDELKNFDASPEQRGQRQLSVLAQAVRQALKQEVSVE